MLDLPQMKSAADALGAADLFLFVTVPHNKVSAKQKKAAREALARALGLVQERLGCPNYECGMGISPCPECAR